MEDHIQDSVVLGHISDEFEIIVNATFHNPHLTSSAAYRPLISDGAMWYLNIYMNTLVCGTTALFGTINNVINLRIFSKLGFKDSMSVCLFCLALTDLLLSVVVLLSRVFPVWDAFFSTEHVDPNAIWYAAFDWLADSLFHCSGWITTFLAIERCFCVTFPFKVKQIFTRSRAIVMVLLIYAGSAFIYVPIYATHRLRWMTTTGRNQTVSRTHNRTLRQTVNGTDAAAESLGRWRRLEITFSENREEIEYYINVINGHFLPLLSLFLILGSVIWMTYGLHRSSRIRQSLTQTIRTKDTTERRHSGAGGGAGVKQQDRNLNYKTRRLIKVVLILAIVFMLCNLPRTFAMHMHVLDSEVRQSGRESNMYAFQWHFTSFATVVNASVNIFVYLTINSSYRAIFKDLFWNKRAAVKTQ